LVSDNRPAPTHVSLRRLVPNFITTAALCCGVAALHFAVKAGADPNDLNWNRALIAVTAAAILDTLDGRAARLLRVASPFGATLDSMADFVSFGVAPAFLLFRWKLHDLEPFGFLIAGVYALCAALRLARFAAMARRGKSGGGGYGVRYFLGMPTPGAAGAALVPLLLDASRKLDLQLPVWLVAGNTLLVAVLMVSRLPIFSLKGLRVSRRMVIPLMAAVGAVVVSGTRDPWLTLAGLSIVYLLTVPVSIVMGHRAERRALQAAAPGEATGPKARTKR
jgi:CDP-diacylglycerol--serine O-phosphatidyltransferase